MSATVVTLTVLGPDAVRGVERGERAPDWHPGYPAATDVSLVRLAVERVAWCPGADLGLHALRAGGVVVGTVSLAPLGDPEEGWLLGYHVVEPARRQGIATAAVRLVTASWSPLRAETDPANTASATVLRRAGFAAVDLGDPAVLQWVYPPPA